MAVVLSGLLSRHFGALWGVVLPTLIVIYTILTANTRVHAEAVMGQGLFVMFFLVPLCVASLIGYAGGLFIRKRDSDKRP